MFLYTKEARLALKKLISANLKIEKLSKKHVSSLLRFSLHGMLPSDLYDEAIGVSVINVRFFNLDTIKVSDLIASLKYFDTVPKELENTIMYHKKTIIESGDESALKFLMANDLIYIEDVKAILEKQITTTTFLLINSPRLACGYMQLTALELVATLLLINKEDWVNVISKINISEKQLLYFCERLSYPPVNPTLKKIKDEAKCLEFIKKHFEYPVIKYVCETVKASKTFVYGCIEIIDKKLPKLNKHLNEFIASTIVPEELVLKYGIRAIVMFGIKIPLNIDTLTVSEQCFVEQHIALYDAAASRFSIRFRDRSQRLSKRTLTMRSGDKLVNHPLVRHIKCQNAVLDDILKYVDAANYKISKGELDNLMSDFCMDPLACQTIIMSTVSLKTKLLAIKVIRNWKTYSLSSTSTFSRMVSGIIYMDLFDYTGARILQTYKKTYDEIIRCSNTPMPPECDCFNCIITYNPITKRKLFSKVLQLSHTNLIKDNLVVGAVTDSVLLSILSDLILLARHGVVDLDFLNTRAWGPLVTLFAGTKSLNVSIFRQATAMEQLEQANICSDGLSDSSNLVKLSNVYLCDIIKGYSPINPEYVSVVLFFNCIIEYMQAICMYRIHICKNTKRTREFITKVISTVLDTLNIPHEEIPVNSIVVTEMLEIESCALQVHSLHLFLKVVLMVLEDINGNY
ncbi:virulence protein [Pteropox virus]|uniref:Virulence protein n=1 Tax=Pteropox virus TaxID=1873698 RepID=A0A1B1MRG2_9POXV|nr:virulence protein [Pteropox virus]ANS71129.1 virulence protein [Pteropox virus]